MTHIVGDLETMGNTPGSVLASLGAVVADPHSDELGEEFYMTIDEESCLAVGLIKDPATVAWWQEPERAEAYAALKIDPRPLVEVLTAFSAYWARNEGTRFWGQGKDYDLPLLTAAYRAAGLPMPWGKKHNVGRDTRTAYEMGGVTVTKHSGTHHIAIDDARTEARDVQEAYRRLGLRAVRNSDAQRTLFAWLADVPEMLLAGTPLNPDQVDAVIHMIRGREDAFQTAAIAPPPSFQWWAGDNEEVYRYGPHKSRQAALDDASGNMEPGQAAFVIEAITGALNFDARRVIEHLLDSSEDLYGESADPDRDGTPAAIKLANDELQTLLDGWLDKHRHTFTEPDKFEVSRNFSTWTVPDDNRPEAAAVAS
jgi:hypothetical protein